MDDETKGMASGRLKRIAGQVGGIQRMLDEDRSCVEVLLQITAAQAALNETAKLLLGSHVETALDAASRSRVPAARRKALDELVAVFARFCLVGRPSEAGELSPELEAGSKAR